MIRNKKDLLFATRIYMYIHRDIGKNFDSNQNILNTMKIEFKKIKQKLDSRISAIRIKVKTRISTFFLKKFTKNNNNNE